MSSMFSQAINFNQNLQGWKLTSITSNTGLQNIFDADGAGAMAMNQTFSDSAGGGTWHSKCNSLANITDFYTNGDDYDGNPATLAQFPKLIA